jgi:hypothetical protein
VTLEPPEGAAPDGTVVAGAREPRPGVARQRTWSREFPVNYQVIVGMVSGPRRLLATRAFVCGGRGGSRWYAWSQ